MPELRLEDCCGGTTVMEAKDNWEEEVLNIG
jgi:hypothetical protein